jgi:hypothetical protein
MLWRRALPDFAVDKGFNTDSHTHGDLFLKSVWGVNELASNQRRNSRHSLVKPAVTGLWNGPVEGGVNESASNTCGAVQVSPACRS